MTNKALLNYYVRLIKKEALTLEDVPDDMVEAVQRKLNGEEEVSNEKHEKMIIEDDSNNKLGAKSLPNKIITVNGDEFTSTGKLNIGCLITEILNNETMPINEEYPKDIDFELVRTENVFGRFVSIPNVNVFYDKEYCILKITMDSRPNVFFRPGDEIIRVDLKLVSSNYEDMSMTVYVKAE